MAAAVLDGRPAGDDVVAGRVRAAAGRRSAGGARAAATARSSNGRYTRAFAARGLGTAQGRVGGEAAHRPARTGREGRAGADGRGDPCAGPARARREAVASLVAAGRHANRAPEHPPRGRQGPRNATRGRGAGRRCRISGPTSGRSCARRRSAPPPPSTRRASSLVLAGLEPDRHWRVRAALAETLGTLPAELATDRAARRCCRTRTSASSRRCSSSLARLKASDLRAVLVQRLDDPDFVVRATAARELGTLKPEGGADGAAAGVQDGAAPTRRTRHGRRRSKRWPRTALPRRRAR